MKIGKYPEISYTRSVLKKLGSISEGLKPGVDAATVSLEDITLVMSSNCILKWFQDCEAYYLQKTVNALCEKGGVPKSIQLEINVPEKYDEKQLGKKIQAFHLATEKKQIPIAQVRVYKGIVGEVIAHLTVLGTSDRTFSSKNVKPGMDIVMAGAVGVGGTAILCRMFESRLKEKFPQGFVKECLHLFDLLSVEKAAQTALREHPVYLHNISDGGVFSALWELGNCCNKGICVDLKQFPVWQHTIEAAEFFDINPYQLEGSGSILIVCENGQELAEKLREADVFASVIGQITADNDKIVRNGDETRYLEPPKGDELYQFL